mgnify:CR=1 FL=1
MDSQDRASIPQEETLAALYRNLVLVSVVQL